MEELGVPGWITFSEGIGHNPDDKGGRDYSGWADRGFGIIVRLNNGYGSNGTIPYQKHYEMFARRCANFVAASKGCRIWIIGNETNLPVEWPKYEGQPEPITPEMYVRCFRACRDAIRALPGRGQDTVLVQAVAPWYAGEGRTYIRYTEEILQGLAGACDGLALHAYTHGPDPNSPFSGEQRNGNMYWHLRVYLNFIEAIPAALRPKMQFYITESATCDPHVWTDANSGWVKNAHIEINRWNSDPKNPKIRSLCLYRWQPFDQHNFGSKSNVVQDWREAMRLKFHWTKAKPRRADPSAVSAPAADRPKAGFVTPRASTSNRPDGAWTAPEESFLEYAGELQRQGRAADAREVLLWIRDTTQREDVREAATSRLAEPGLR
jgi:hypothetical protein